ncbi:hypothetical protein ACTXPK_14380, partial [Glutamicibacter arilaitensis]|uniref:hypothetical protein n=1 Tax=Glutamicibacter arilaitensis TaxID=256701 RepID=UPI003FD2373D
AILRSHHPLNGATGVQHIWHYFPGLSWDVILVLFLRSVHSSDITSEMKKIPNGDMMGKLKYCFNMLTCITTPKAVI